MPIGVDEWVAQHTDRRDAGTGWRRAMYTVEARVGWWPRLLIIFVLIFLNTKSVTKTIIVLLAGVLFVVSATSSEGTDLRPGRYTDLASLVQNESDQYDALQQRVKDLQAEVAALTSSVQDTHVKRFQRKVDALKDPAGLRAAAGPPRWPDWPRSPPPAESPAPPPT